MNLKNMIKSKNVKNASWLIFGKIIHMVLSFVIGMITARYLGPSNYGLINYAAAYVTFFTSVCTLGINSV
ncbi:MAG: oligosaccharide flippase family protein, partial [Clostridia bacterium]|nr:oligosaccharide flippase family protein [Clostridia bacterium]